MNPELLALIQAVLGAGNRQPIQAQAGHPAPMLRPMGSQGTPFAPVGGIHPGAQVADGPLGENAHLGWRYPVPPQKPPAPMYPHDLPQPQTSPLAAMFGRLFTQPQKRRYL